MPQYFQNPLNALKKAEGFLAVGKKQAGLEVLIDLLRSKKHRSYTKDHDDIINVYLDITIDLKKSQQAKEGLYQFKNISQSVCPKSLENVIVRFLEKSESRTEEARLQSQQIAERRVEDLDLMDQPENMLMKAVTGEKTQDRTDRLVLTPWLKFLWESYRQVLDLLRNNTRVEKLYHTVARKAFAFCKKYDRRTEFRKLCDNLRNHIKLSENRASTQFSVQLNSEVTQSLQLDTKVQQLDFAIQIELWQEAFKAIEDIHTLMCMSRNKPKPSLLNDFYIKMSKVFIKSESMLFHACTIFKLFMLYKEQKRNPTKDDLTRKASKLLVAMLSIPITKQKHGVGKILDMEETIINKVLHLSKLLGLEKAPMRETLLEDFMKYDLLNYVPQQLKDLHEWLENTNHPLKMADRVTSVFEWMHQQTAEPELVNYIPHLRQVVITRVLQQVSSLYKSISFKRLLKFLPSAYCSRFELEQFIVDASRNGQLQVRIDHMKNCVYFGTDLNASPLYVEDEFFESKRLQALPSERVSASFNMMVRSMLESHYELDKEAMQRRSEEKMSELLSLYNKTKAKTHSLMLRRKQIIEDRKERMESEKNAKEEKERLAQQQQEKAAREAEQARISKEQKEREEKMRLQQEEAEQRRNANDKLEMWKKTDIGKKLFAEVQAEDLMKKDFNTEDMVNKQIVLKEKEKKEINNRRKAQERKIDHLERAKRQEEIPLIEKYMADKRVNDRIQWEQFEAERVEKSRADHAKSVATKERLLIMRQDVDDHMRPLREAVQQEYQENMRVWEEEKNRLKAERLEKRRYERKLKRFAQRMKEKEEAAEAERKRQEEMEREEEERRRREEEQARQQQIEEERRKRDEQAMKQRQRELEIEEKQKNRQNLFGQKSAEPSTTAWRPSRSRAQPDNSNDTLRSRRAPQQEPAGDSWRRGGQQEPSADKWRPRRAMDDNRPPAQGAGRFANLNSDNPRRNDSPRGGRFGDDNRGGRFGDDNRGGRFGDDSRGGNRNDSFRGGRRFNENPTRSDRSDWGRGAPAGRERRENPQGRSDSPANNMRRGEPAGQQPGNWRSKTTANNRTARGEGPKQDDGWTQVNRR